MAYRSFWHWLFPFRAPEWVYVSVSSRCLWIGWGSRQSQNVESVCDAVCVALVVWQFFTVCVYWVKRVRQCVESTTMKLQSSWSFCRKCSDTIRGISFKTPCPQSTVTKLSCWVGMMMMIQIVSFIVTTNIKPDHFEPMSHKFTSTCTYAHNSKWNFFGSTMAVFLFPQRGKGMKYINLRYLLWGPTLSQLNTTKTHPGSVVPNMEKE